MSLDITGCVTLSMSLNLGRPQFPLYIEQSLEMSYKVPNASKIESMVLQSQVQKFKKCLLGTFSHIKIMLLYWYVLSFKSPVSKNKANNNNNNNTSEIPIGPVNTINDLHMR